MAAKATMKNCASLQVRTRWTVLLIFTCGMAAAAQAPSTSTPGPNSQATPVDTGKRLTLQEAFSRADKQNLDLAAARLKRAVALAGIIIAGQRPNPTITVSVTRDLPHESVFV